MNYNEIDAKIKAMLSTNRYDHSFRVMDCALTLADIYGCDYEKTRIAAISHDCAKELSCEVLVNIAQSEDLNLDEVTLSEPQLLHGPIGRVIATKDLDIKDDDILNAIHYHTTGRKNMTTLEKIIYLADVIEIGRNYHGIEEVRKLSTESLDKAIVMAIDNTIRYVISINSLLHPRTIELRNSILLRMKI